MALTGTDRGGNSSGTVATSFNCTVSSNCTAGALIVLCLAYDNAGTNGADPFVSISDSIGNTWTSQIVSLNDPGAASAGVCLRIFTTPQDVGPLQTTTTITVSFGAVTVVSKAWAYHEFTSSIGTAIYKGGNQATASSLSPTITTTSILNTHAVVAAVGIEAGTTEVATGDSDTTNGNWSTKQDFAVGSTSTGMYLTSQRKIVTATGTQTYNPTFSIPGDLCIAWAEIGESVVVTPGKLSLSLITFAPTVQVPRTVTPGTKALVTTKFAPTIQFPKTVTPGTKALVTTKFAPVVQLGKIVTPGTKALVTTKFAPTVQVPRTVVPGTKALALTKFAPVVQTPKTVVPGKLSLSLLGFAPVVQTPKTVVPGTLALTLTESNPTVLLPQTVYPGVASLTLTTYDPTVTGGIGIAKGVFGGVGMFASGVIR